MSATDRLAAVSRRLFLKALAAGMGTAGALTACGAPAGSAEVPAPTAVPVVASPQAVTLRVSGNQPWLDEAVKRFESANPGVTVSFDQADGSINVLREALRTGVDAPDICMLGADALGVVAPTDALVDLAAVPFDGASLKQSMVDAVWS
ncbi:MAG TPA: hypothetical protein VEZ12_17005, partial [Herpetosiphonaceae bacterium]|nr:hypothetical protein [Herpetosiphonaceae bacterium]